MKIITVSPNKEGGYLATVSGQKALQAVAPTEVEALDNLVTLLKESNEKWSVGNLPVFYAAEMPENAKRVWAALDSQKRILRESGSLKELHTLYGNEASYVKVWVNVDKVLPGDTKIEEMIDPLP